MRSLFRVLFTLIVLVVVAAAALVLWLWIAEYRPADKEIVTATSGVQHDFVEIGKTYHIVTLNIGYGGLGRDRNFFMDGGDDVMPESQDEVQETWPGMLSVLYGQQADLVLLQEVDIRSRRSFSINEAEFFRAGLSMGKAFAYNFKVPFVPFPLPPIGKVESGLMTLSNLKVEEARRVSLPATSGWPVRLANLKRALLVEYLPVDGTDQYLVLINLHLEAYTTGEAREKQLERFVVADAGRVREGQLRGRGRRFQRQFPRRGGLVSPDRRYRLAARRAAAGRPAPGLFLRLRPERAHLPLAGQGVRRATGTNHVMYAIDGFIVSRQRQGQRHADHRPELHLYRPPARGDGLHAAMNANFVLKGHIIWCDSPSHINFVPHGYLVCENGRSAGVFEALPERYQHLPLTDFGGRLVIPGMYDLHLHAPQYAYRGMGMDLELIDWLQRLRLPRGGEVPNLAYAKRAYAMFAEALKRSFTARFCCLCHAARARNASAFGVFGGIRPARVRGQTQHGPQRSRRFVRAFGADGRGRLRGLLLSPCRSAFAA